MSRRLFVVLISVLLISVLILGTIIIYLSEKRNFSIAYDEIIGEACAKYNLEKPLIYAVIKTESAFDESAISAAGAVGLMQIMPATGKELYEKKYEGDFNVALLMIPEININLGCIYLSELLTRTGSYKWALAAYNAGEREIKKWQNSNLNIYDFPYRETRDYLLKIKANLKGYEIYRNMHSDIEIVN